MKICFITSLFAENYNDGDKPINFKINKKYDYYLFTNVGQGANQGLPITFTFKINFSESCFKDYKLRSN